MIGLPGDSLDTCIYSARQAVSLKPQLARLYPTIVLDETELFNMYASGKYQPLSREEAILRTKEMYKILDSAGITIMRVGLKSTDIIGDGGAVNGGTYHPAFRQLVEGRIARERIEEKLAQLIDGRTSSAKRIEIASSQAGDAPARVEIGSHPSWFSNMIGHHAENRKYFSDKYPDFVFTFSSDPQLAAGQFSVSFVE